MGQESASNRACEVTLEGVSFSYPGASAAAVRDVTMRVERGEVLAIVGPNGAGKSTLIKLIAGLLGPRDGVMQGALKVGGLSPVEARRQGLIGYVPQVSEAERRFPMSVRQAVELGATARHVGWGGWRGVGAGQRDWATKCLEMVEAGAYADKPVGAISGGQFRRMLIARALAGRPGLLVLDEPAAGLDAPGQRRLGEVIKSVHDELGVTVLMVSHDLRAIAMGGSNCDRVACLRKTLHFHAAPEGLTPGVLIEVFQHDLADIFGEVHVEAHKASDCTDPAHHHTHTKDGGCGGGRGSGGTCAHD
ncbi:MAG: metal ABC transporter ATP-binding protein [Phycisphaeraceae bacterium]|nr:metal ABC transporter ATP-binding protein [Phycisphaerales bacterium]MCB9843900.1 metal ABC transporter ATP-binding protein [Phycisphaeraceae bacterium]